MYPLGTQIYSGSAAQISNWTNILKTFSNKCTPGKFFGCISSTGVYTIKQTQEKRNIQVLLLVIFGSLDAECK